MIPGGWHVITHADLDDPDEPRTVRLLHELAYYRPRSVEQVEQRLGDLLRSHGTPPDRSGAPDSSPPVCLHEGPMRTVSSSLVTFTRDGARLRHADGRPCDHRFVDHTALLRSPARAGDAGS